MNGADAIVKILQMEGIRQVFCYPLTNLLDALARAGVRILSSRQERVAGNMADGVSRSTNGRQIGVFTVQSRAGAENAFAGVAHSFTDSTPVLFLPGHAGLDQIGTHPSFDCVDNYRATTKMANKVISPELAPSRLRHAFTALRSGRPGPVMLEVLDDACKAEFTGDLEYTPIPRMRVAADPGAVEEAAERLLRAERPMIWAGQGILYAEASRELVEVAEILGIPVMTTLQGKSGFPERHELSAGVGAYSVTYMARHCLADSDLILAVGSSLTVAPFTPPIPPGKAIIHATVDPSDINKEYPAALPVVADAKLFLRQLADVLKSKVGKDRKAHRQETVETLSRHRNAWLEEFESLFSDDSQPINGYRMFRELWSAIDPDTSIVTHESGASRDIQSVFYQANTPRSYLGWGQSSQLGFSLGLAMGAKIANPDKLVVNVMGDASVGMTGMDWETAVRENIPILTVIKHDSIFSGYDRHIPVAIERYKISTQTGDYANVARALGCHAEKVETVQGLQPALKRAIQATRDGQPAVVDVITAETRKLSKIF